MSFMSIWMLYMAYLYEYQMDDNEITFTLFGVEQSFFVTGRISSASWIIFLFTGKLAVNSIRKARNQCIAIKYSPFIEWQNDDGNPAAPMKGDVVSSRSMNADL